MDADEEKRQKELFRMYDELEDKEQRGTISKQDANARRAQIDEWFDEWRNELDRKYGIPGPGSA